VSPATAEQKTNVHLSFEKSNARREEESIISEAPRREDETTASDGPLVPGLEEPSLEQPAPVLVSFDQRPFINNGAATANSNARPGAAVNGVLQRGTPKNGTNRPAHPATQSAFHNQPARAGT
jgi:hypothetical protein